MCVSKENVFSKEIVFSGNKNRMCPILCSRISLINACVHMYGDSKENVFSKEIVFSRETKRMCFTLCSRINLLSVCVHM